MSVEPTKEFTGRGVKVRIVERHARSRDEWFLAFGALIGASLSLISVSVGVAVGVGFLIRSIWDLYRENR